MKSLMELWQVVLDDMGTRCCTSTTRDKITAARRSKTEGFSFFTLTLPAFGKEFERALDQGAVTPSMFVGFKRNKHEELPRFLGGFLEMVFDRSTGQLCTSPCIVAIQAVRQICGLLAKIELECADWRVSSAWQGFVYKEQQLEEYAKYMSVLETQEGWTDADLAQYGCLEQKLQDTYQEWLGLERICGLLFEETLSQLSEDIDWGVMLPKHGPGATADRVLGNSKYKIQRWYQRMIPLFPMEEWIVSSSNFRSQLDDVQLLEPEAEIPVRVISVPKTMKTPRIIAAEPCHVMYVQQALSSALVQYLSADKLANRFINFRDQTPNQRMAEKGSSDGSLATLDLSEASDSVSNQLVQFLFRRWPAFAEALDMTRSRWADVPEQGIIPLHKFASMGSALTFPIEMMVFLAIIFHGIEKERNCQLTKESIKRLSGKVRVFGDDIIVPSDTVESVIANLEAFGFSVNASKSFWKGKFRESCGKEYYDGQDVSLVKVRKVLPTNGTDDTEITSCVSLRNQFYMAGLWSAAMWLDRRLEKLIPFPIVEPSSPVYGRWSVSFSPMAEKIHADHQVPLVRGMVNASKSPKSLLDGYAALLKFFLHSEVSKDAELTWEPRQLLEKDHLERSGRPVSVSIKKRWAMPY